MGEVCRSPLERTNPCERRRCDYSSIPQRNVAQQQIAIRSLVAFASTASAFVIVAPPVRHREEHKLCDAMTYRSRMWTRTEQLCYALRNGTRRMWLVTSPEPRHMRPVDHEADWLTDNLFIFEGTATD